jgi:hypothetical protein
MKKSKKKAKKAIFYVDSFFDIPIIRPTETQTVLLLIRQLTSQEI